MDAMTAVPPFEFFYVEQRDVVLGFLRRRLGGQAGHLVGSPPTALQEAS